MSAAALAVAFVVATSHTSFADMTRGVMRAFRGQIVITNGELPDGNNDKDTIAKIKKEQLEVLTGTANEKVTSWYFHYTAFLSKTGAKTLRMQFLKGKQLAADKMLDGIDPKTPILAGDISITEDEGLNKGTTYNIHLVTPSGRVVAKTKLTMK